MEEREKEELERLREEIQKLRDEANYLQEATKEKDDYIKKQADHINELITFITASKAELDQWVKEYTHYASRMPNDPYAKRWFHIACALQQYGRTIKEQSL